MRGRHKHVDNGLAVARPAYYPSTKRQGIAVNRSELLHLRMDKLDWNQLRAFLETAETGSLSAAARKLGLTQSTLSRQVAAIELRTGVTLFERVGQAMVLTPTGLDLLEHARAMGTAAEALGLAATGRSQAVGGVVSSRSRPATPSPRTCCPRWCGSCANRSRAYRSR